MNGWTSESEVPLGGCLTHCRKRRRGVGWLQRGKGREGGGGVGDGKEGEWAKGEKWGKGGKEEKKWGKGGREGKGRKGRAEVDLGREEK